MLIFLFGECGAGKNTVGESLAQHFDFYHWDADLVLTLDMQTAVAAEQALTQAMRDAFVSSLIPSVQALLKQHTRLVVSQALYKNGNRQQLRAAFPEAVWWRVTAPQSVIEARLHARAGVSVDYAAELRKAWEAPNFDHTEVKNGLSLTNLYEELAKHLTDHPDPASAPK